MPLKLLQQQRDVWTAENRIRRVYIQKAQQEIVQDVNDSNPGRTESSGGKRPAGNKQTPSSDEDPSRHNWVDVRLLRDAEIRF